ncbi:MAG: hypothetical protein P0Y62_02595 [Candidatus Chryseobacterium colombiense]|nr:hypothetical protein [Chryseobacterium sp.]WEK70444.1 MAG: hypothetical protein P0Y62_02595 [Chryseobacterium sp.]
MRKLITFTAVVLGFNTIYSQEASNKFTALDFEKQILHYTPKKTENISEKDYNYAMMILKETKESVKSKPENFNLADYFNILNALLTLKETKQNINIAFDKFIHEKGSCEYIKAFENTIKNNPKYDMVRDDYNQQLAKCKATINIEKEPDLQEYSKANNLESSLVQEIYKININDQKYRDSGAEKKLSQDQQVLDKKNQAIIDSLYNKYNTYIGRSLVGKKFESVMWAVIQHSNVEMMDRYLPIVKKAVTNKELEAAPLKMLIDRFYGLKYGYQIFGSQSGFGFKSADEKTKNDVKKKYGIE